MVDAESLGRTSFKADRLEEGQGGRCPQDRRAASLHLGGRHQLRMGNREDEVIHPLPAFLSRFADADRVVPAGTVAVTSLNRLTSFERRCTR